jgi:DNA-directed RNA polymerase specialized sigma24 family protein
VRDSDGLTEVYETARTLLPAAESFAKRGGIDASQAEEILMEAADKVLKGKSRGSEIRNLPAYLFTSYKRLILNRIRRSRNEVELADNKHDRLQPVG